MFGGVLWDHLRVRQRMRRAGLSRASSDSFISFLVLAENVTRQVMSPKRTFFSSRISEISSSSCLASDSLSSTLTALILVLGLSLGVACALGLGLWAESLDFGLPLFLPVLVLFIDYSFSFYGSGQTAFALSMTLPLLFSPVLADFVVFLTLIFLSQASFFSSFFTSCFCFILVLLPIGTIQPSYSISPNPIFLLIVRTIDPNLSTSSLKSTLPSQLYSQTSTYSPSSLLEPTIDLVLSTYPRLLSLCSSGFLELLKWGTRLVPKEGVKSSQSQIMVVLSGAQASCYFGC